MVYVGYPPSYIEDRMKKAQLSPVLKFEREGDEYAVHFAADPSTLADRRFAPYGTTMPRSRFVRRRVGSLPEFSAAGFVQARGGEPVGVAGGGVEGVAGLEALVAPVVAGGGSAGEQGVDL